MPEYSVDDAPPEIQALFERAREGVMSPVEFCRELNQHGVTGATKMLYIRDAFNLPLEQAKMIAIGSNDAWVQGLSDAIDKLPKVDDTEDATVKAS